MKGIIARIYRQSFFILVPLCIISLFLGWRLSLSVAVGGAIGIGNLSGLAWSINALLGAEKAQTKMVLLSMSKLLIIFSIVLLLAALKLINVWGLLAGFTVVTVLIIKAGLTESKKQG